MDQAIMKVRYTGETKPLYLTNGKEYDVLSIEDGWYRVIDDEGIYECFDVQGYLYPPSLFQVIEKSH